MKTLTNYPTTILSGDPPRIAFLDSLLQDIVCKEKLSLRELRVFLFLCSMLSDRNSVLITREVISSGLGMTREDVSRTIVKLKARNLIKETVPIATQKAGSRPVIFSIPDVYLLKGSSKER